MVSNRQWNLGQFLETVIRFDVLPFASTVRQIQAWMQGEPESSQAIPVPLTMRHHFLVSGGPHEFCQALSQRLQQEGPVQALVSDIASARVHWDPSTDLVTAAALPSVLQRTQSVVVSVMASELEPLPLPALIDQMVATWTQHPETVIFDFRHPTDPKGDLKDLWGALDDVVMGGVSESQLQLTADHALFTGTVSTANSGGFASVRTRNFTDPVDLSAYDGLELRVRGDGKRYKLFLRTESGWDTVAYSLSFDTTPGEWLTIRCPFADMTPVFRARRQPEAPALDPSQIRSVQLMLSKFEADRELNPTFSPGPFALQIAWIGAYCAQTQPRLLVITAKSRSQPEWLTALMTHSLPYTIIQTPPISTSGNPVGLSGVGWNGSLSEPSTSDAKDPVSLSDMTELCAWILVQPYMAAATLTVHARTDSSWQQVITDLQRSHSA